MLLAKLNRLLLLLVLGAGFSLPHFAFACVWSTFHIDSNTTYSGCICYGEMGAYPVYPQGDLTQEDVNNYCSSRASSSDVVYDCVLNGSSWQCSCILFDCSNYPSDPFAPSPPSGGAGGGSTSPSPCSTVWDLKNTLTGIKQAFLNIFVGVGFAFGLLASGFFILRVWA
ncbi:hypothetical protein [Hydrogenobacter hydrogenophilus]|uniref:hypothetical protein n=1 Tax=Hydrogenobacter hydrogenophilus TaxID=35835 RepID=UPI0015E005BE|nr:hypothetical protein [Hydrogenobacter hydrogenophilus]